ncbi:unnamed protein product [Heterotrigona itama]|uniref:Uncharacterized protein n=1 Tax=Heterotrigona itama TaxID=395501 RepID=A0A6V7HCU7_9HYME|nr:unnamed protein product [Heterotrigona itama]
MIGPATFRIGAPTCRSSEILATGLASSSRGGPFVCPEASVKISLRVDLRGGEPSGVIATLVDSGATKTGSLSFWSSTTILAVTVEANCSPGGARSDALRISVYSALSSLSRGLANVRAPVNESTAKLPLDGNSATKPYRRSPFKPLSKSTAVKLYMVEPITALSDTRTVIGSCGHRGALSLASSITIFTETAMLWGLPIDVVSNARISK